MKASLIKQFYPVWHFVKLYKSKTIIIVLCLVLSGIVESLGFATLLPLVNLSIGKNIDATSTTNKFIIDCFNYFSLEPTLGAVLIVIAFMITAKSIIVFGSMLEVGYLSTEIVAGLRIKLIKSIMNAEWSYFVKQKAGELSSALSTEVEKAGNSYLAAGKALSGIIQIIAYSCLAVLISPKVTLAAFGVGIVSAFIFKRYVKLSRKSSAQETHHNKSFMALLVDGLKGMKPLKAMFKESQFKEILEKEILNYQNARKRGIYSSYSINYFQEPIQIIVICVGLYFMLGYLNKDIDELFVLVFLFYKTIQRLSTLQIYYQQMASASPSFWFVYGHIQTSEDCAEESLFGDKINFMESIQLKDISFSYGDKSVLKNFNMEIIRGDFYALIGGSGSGKTTIADIVIGLHKPQKGKVLINGYELSTIDQKKWRSEIGYVPQETFLFHDTIYNNITLSDNNISEDDVAEALEKSGAMDFVSELKEGIHSAVGEHGGSLSGGQRQRIAIARALVRKPKLLILDESTTALDPKTEKEIMSTLDILKGEITILAISHQPALKNIAEKIIYLDD